MINNLTAPQKAMIAAALRLPLAGRIYAIKLLRSYTNCLLRDAITAVDSFDINSVPMIDSGYVTRWFELESEKRALEAYINVATVTEQMKKDGIIE